MTKIAAAKIQSARISLILDQPFFGVLALRLRLREQLGLGTAATDGRELIYDPAYIESLTALEVKGIVAHEVMHCALGHPWRRESREPDKWNRACDYAINGVLLKTGFNLPADALNDPQWDGRSAEFIYRQLPDNTSGKSRCQCVKDAPKPGDGTAGSGPNDPTTLEEDWRQAVQQSARMAQAQGQLPGDLKDFVLEATRPRVDWRSALRRFVQQAAASDYSYVRPNRRFLSHGMYMPALYAPDLGAIAVAIDTSGSVSRVLGVFEAELKAIVQETSPQCVYVIYCDARVQATDVFERGEIPAFQPRGGGGTDFRPVFRELVKLENKPVCLIYLTDLDGRFPDETIETPTLWVSTTVEQPPFGETLFIGDGI